jgi:truncated hemoglobin YjbI
VAQFYQYALNDESINSFYLENVSDIPKLHSTMVLFLTHLFGGPNHYKGPNMYELHKNMHIPRDVYDRNWGHMESAFLVYKLDKALIAELKDAWFTTKNDVCSHSPK